MKRCATIGVAVAPLVAACSIYDFEGMALINPEQTIVIGDTVSMIMVDTDGVMPPRSEVLWWTSDGSIAVVDELGLVRGTGPGVATIGGATGGYSLEVPIKVWAPARLTSIAAGAAHTCGLDAGGQALCWGSNIQGQLGLRSTPSYCETPAGNFSCGKSAIPIESEERFTELAAGYYHVCGLTTDGSAHCWGSNDAGQLGDGTSTTRRPVPGPVDGADVFRTLAAGGRTTCGITVDDRLLCWGESRSSTLGDANRPTPTEIAPALRFDQLEIATSGGHICGIVTTGSAWCWGSNASGQLGAEDVAAACPTQAPQYPCTADPVEVQGAQLFARLAAGGDFTCGLTHDGLPWCWGLNDRGQLGDGTGADGWQPRAVAGGHTFSTIATAGARACGVEADRLWCWGFDGYDFGNGGDPGPTEAFEPVASAGELALVDVAVGPSHICAIAPDGVTWCWGSGPLGDGAFDVRNPPIAPVRVVLWETP